MSLDNNLTKHAEDDGKQRLAVSCAPSAMAKVAYFTPHDMRRSFISSLLDVGVDLSMAQTLAGHVNISTTQLYDRRGEKSKREAIDRLPFPT